MNDLESKKIILDYRKQELNSLEDVWKQKLVFNEASKQMLQNQEKQIIQYAELIRHKKIEIEQLEKEIQQNE